MATHTIKENGQWITLTEEEWKERNRKGCQLGCLVLIIVLILAIYKCYTESSSNEESKPSEELQQRIEARQVQ